MPHQQAWDESHFDEMSWHDNHVHGLRVRRGPKGGMANSSSISTTFSNGCAPASRRSRFESRPPRWRSSTCAPGPIP